MLPGGLRPAAVDVLGPTGDFKDWLWIGVTHLVGELHAACRAEDDAELRRLVPDPVIRAALIKFSREEQVVANCARDGPLLNPQAREAVEAAGDRLVYTPFKACLLTAWRLGWTVLFTGHTRAAMERAGIWEAVCELFLFMRAPYIFDDSIRCLLEIQQAGDMSAIVPPGTQSPFLSAGNKRVSLAGRKFNSLASIAVTTECKFTIRICMAVFLPLFRSYEAVSVSGQVVKLQQAPGLAITFANPQSPGVRGLFLAVAFCQNGLISGGNCMGGGFGKWYTIRYLAGDVQMAPSFISNQLLWEGGATPARMGDTQDFALLQTVCETRPASLRLMAASQAPATTAQTDPPMLFPHHDNPVVTAPVFMPGWRQPPAAPAATPASGGGGVATTGAPASTALPGGFSSTNKQGLGSLAVLPPNMQQVAAGAGSQERQQQQQQQQGRDAAAAAACGGGNGSSMRTASGVVQSPSLHPLQQQQLDDLMRPWLSHDCWQVDGGVDSPEQQQQQQPLLQPHQEGHDAAAAAAAVSQRAGGALSASVPINPAAAVAGDGGGGGGSGSSVQGLESLAVLPPNMQQVAAGAGSQERQQQQQQQPLLQPHQEGHDAAAAAAAVSQRAGGALSASVPINPAAAVAGDGGGGGGSGSSVQGLGSLAVLPPNMQQVAAGVGSQERQQQQQPQQQQQQQQGRDTAAAAAAAVAAAAGGADGAMGGHGSSLAATGGAGGVGCGGQQQQVPRCVAHKSSGHQGWSLPPLSAAMEGLPEAFAGGRAAAGSDSAGGDAAAAGCVGGGGGSSSSMQGLGSLAVLPPNMQQVAAGAGSQERQQQQQQPQPQQQQQGRDTAAAAAAVSQRAGGALSASVPINPAAAVAGDGGGGGGSSSSSAALRCDRGSGRGRGRGSGRGRGKKVFRGVFWNKREGRWKVQLGHQRKTIHLGYFDKAVDAARAYDRKSVEINGRMAHTNFPISDYLPEADPVPLQQLPLQQLPLQQLYQLATPANAAAIAAAAAQPLRGMCRPSVPGTNTPEPEDDGDEGGSSGDESQQR